MSETYKSISRSSTGSPSGPSSGPSSGSSSGPSTGSSSGRPSIKNKSISKKKIFITIGILIGILIIIALFIGWVVSFAFGPPSKKVCPAPPNMKWIIPTPNTGDIESNYNAILQNSLECTNTGATPIPSQGLLKGCTSPENTRLTVDGVVPTCPPPTTQSTTGSSNSEPSSCLAIPGTFEWTGPAPTYGETRFSSDRITCTGPSPTPTPGNTIFSCSRNGTIAPFTPCPSSDGFTNYLGELMDWVSGRPDINQQSKYSLLPGYFN